MVEVVRSVYVCHRRRRGTCWYRKVFVLGRSIGTDVLESMGSPISCAKSFVRGSYQILVVFQLLEIGKVTRVCCSFRQLRLEPGAGRLIGKNMKCGNFSSVGRGQYTSRYHRLDFAS